MLRCSSNISIFLIMRVFKDILSFENILGLVISLFRIVLIDFSVDIRLEAGLVVFYVLSWWLPGCDGRICVKLSTLRFLDVLKILYLLLDGYELELDRVVSFLAIFTVLAFARFEHIFTHLGLASRFYFLVGSAIIASICVIVLRRAFSSYFLVSYHVVSVHKHFLVNSFLTEICCHLSELFKFFDVFFHVLNMAAIRVLFSLTSQVQVLDTLVQEHILAIGSMVEGAYLLDIKTNGCEGDTTFKSISHEIFVRDILRMPLRDVGFFR